MTQSLESLLTWYQSLRIFGENVLVAGLVGDFLVIMFLHEGGKRERVGSLIGTALILVGVGIENFAGGRADDVVRQMRAPRSLSAEQRELLVNKLRPFAGQRVNFVVKYMDEEEPAHIARQLLEVLGRAGWPSNGQSTEVDREPVTYGIAVGADESAPLSAHEAARALASALREAYLEVTDPSPSDIKTFSLREPVRIIVGRK